MDQNPIQGQPPPQVLTHFFFAIGRATGHEPEARGTMGRGKTRRDFPKRGGTKESVSLLPLRAHFFGNKGDVWVRG